MNFNRSIEILIILIAIGAPILKKVFESLARQRAQSRADTERQRRIEENLRTGRGGEAPAQPAAAPVRREEPRVAPQAVEAEALARRRQAQLEELRRRASQRAASTADSVSRIPGSTGPTVPMPKPARQPQGGARRAGPQPTQTRGGSRPDSRATTQRPGKRASTGANRRPADRQTSRPAPPPPPPAPPATRRIVAETKPPVPQEPAHPMLDAATDLVALRSADWRRAIVMREVLDPPLALRPIEDA